MKTLNRKYVVLVATVLLVVVAMLTFSTWTTGAAKDKCFVTWGEPNTVHISVFYADGDVEAKTFPIDEARQYYAGNNLVLEKIEELAATERNVVWWASDGMVYIGIGDTGETLAVTKAQEKYRDNPIISEKLRDLLSTDYAKTMMGVGNEFELNQDSTVSAGLSNGSKPDRPIAYPTSSFVHQNQNFQTKTSSEITSTGWPKRHPKTIIQNNAQNPNWLGIFYSWKPLCKTKGLLLM